MKLLSNASDKLLEFQCPKCAKRLKAVAQAAGKRLKCPGCGQPVKVPGVPLEKKADEDWMQLDLPQPTAPEPIPNSQFPNSQIPDSQPARPQPAVSQPPGSRSSKTKPAPPPSRPVSIFDDDLPELAELEAPSTRASTNEPFRLTEYDSSPPPVVKPKPSTKGAAPSTANAGPAPGKPSASKPSGTRSESGVVRPVAVNVEDQHYRVPCPSCGTPQHVTLADVGKKAKCPDCFLVFQIPPPPKNWKPGNTSGPVKWSTELAALPTDEVDRDAERARSNAADMLRSAEKELDDADIDSMYQGDFDTKSFVNRTFGFCFDKAAVLQILLLSLFFSILFLVEQICLNKVAEGDKGYALIAGLIVPMFFVIISFPLFACAMAHLESVANGHSKVREWPGFNFFDHIGELLLFGAALAAAVVPGVLLGGFVGRSGGMQWMVISAALLTSFLFFPIILLSMLDNDSMFNPFSTDVLTSIGKGTEAWGAFYLKTFLAYFFFFIAVCLLLRGSPILTGLAGALLPWLLFFTTQQIGVLAFDISESLSLPKQDASSSD